ncbi:anti-sigma factor [Blastococcus sp. SYSU DS0617]
MSTPRPGPGHDEAFEELAVGWALHALEPEDAELFLTHLDGCPYCRQLVEETAEVMASMAGAAPAAEPPRSLGERLRAEVARTPQDTPYAVAGAPAGASARPAEPPAAAPVAVPAPRRRWMAALVAAALAAVVGLGGWTVALLDDRDEAQRTAAAQAALVDQLLRPGPATVVPVDTDDGRTVATLLARDDGVQVVSQGLPANDVDAETYVLWGLDEGTPRALGTFDVTGSDVQLSSIEVDGADDFPGYGISIEPGDSAPEAPTDVVARGSLPS